MFDELLVNRGSKSSLPIIPILSGSITITKDSKE